MKNNLPAERMHRPIAIITGASSGIGFELAKCCAEHGFDLVIAADEPEIFEAAQTLSGPNTLVEPFEVDLATTDGIEALYAGLKGRTASALLANAGRGLGKGFLDQETAAWKRVIDTNITGTLCLIQKVARDMRQAHAGRILITGSIAGMIPGTYQAVYNASKAFLDSFSFALRHELHPTGISVTCLMPGATETEFFERADLEDTKIAQSKKEDPARVARAGFDAMMRGDGDVIVGWQTKLQAAIASILPADVMAGMHEKQAAPGSGLHRDRHK